ncbi:DUF4158 domain-containing protein [Frankia sp. R82]|nr:DUF4158 domain-containing protein [Frankia sp. R82]MCM3886646.1 DUF4158 domain-containing protein [Frankia sp. R82]
MVAPVLVDEELEGLRRFPEIGREELFRFFTLTPADLAFLDPGRGRGWGPADRLGLAVALCALPWLGFVPDDVASAPRAAVLRLAERLGVDPDVIGSYGRRAKTRTDHLRLAARYLGWRVPTTLDLKVLDEFLLARAMEHDSPTLLFRLACEYLISAKVRSARRCWTWSWRSSRTRRSWSSAGWSASPLTPPGGWRRSRKNCTRRWASWSRRSPLATGRFAWTPTVIW